MTPGDEREFGDGDGDNGDGDGDGDAGDPICGDGNVDMGEECDDGNADDTDACTSACLNAVCGDGFVQMGVEGCDDANTTDGDGCSATCVIESCGDGVMQVLCDMTTDGGGWTMVASTRTTTLDDAAIAYHNDLQTTTPLAPTRACGPACVR